MKFKRPVKILGNFVRILAVALLLSLSFPQLYGMKCYAVASGSMSPAFPVGSAVYIKKRSPEQVEKGDVITFKAENGKTMITHRVVENRKEKQFFITKGDANDSQDIQPVKWENLCGVVAFSIPFAGYMLKFLGSKKGKMAVLFFLVAFSFGMEMSGGETIKKESETE